MSNETHGDRIINEPELLGILTLEKNRASPMGCEMHISPFAAMRISRSISYTENSTPEERTVLCVGLFCAFRTPTSFIPLLRHIRIVGPDDPRC